MGDFNPAEARFEWTMDELSVTPNEDIQGLVEQWRDVASTEQMPGDQRAIFNMCADELEELIDE